MEGVFNAAVSRASFPSKMLTANIIPLLKPWKDSAYVQNFRPISFLNVKVYAKIISTRLQTFLPALVKPDQVGFVPGRQAPDATRRVLNLIHRAETS